LQILNQFLVKFFEVIHGGVASVITNPNYSYGIAIILVTVIIRVILLPLNLKQTKSTVRMNEIQPEVKKLQDKYKNDPKKSQEELMKLYKEKGVNPMGGCLPLLIQWPVLIALYYVFNNLPGINGVQFLWIKNLGAGATFVDPLHNWATWILPLLSAGTQYYSGILMAPPGNSAQAKQSSTMNLSMAVFMIFISWKLKAALVLYWVISNIIQILQTVIYKKVDQSKRTSA
jgi:YidC/Oxa1 family membrane protein insertase